MKTGAAAVRLCLVNPPVMAVVETEYDRPRYPHEGLARLAGAVRAAGETVVVIDAKRERLSLAATVARLREIAPDLVGFTALTHEVTVAARVALAVKAFRPDTITLLGGCHATAVPVETLREFPALDLIVAGEGELALPELLTALAHHGDPAAVRGVTCRREGEIRSHPPAPPPAALDDLPAPAWDLLPPSSGYILTTARGCPYTCPFCQNPGGRTVRSQSPERTMEDLERLLADFHPRELYFGNENFLLPSSVAPELLERMIAANLGARLRWSAQTHVATVTPERAVQLRAAGCYHLALGVESGNEETLRWTEKGVTRDMARRAVAAVRAAGIETEVNVILGHPRETMASARETLAFLAELNPTLPAIGIMVPYPGTEVRRMAERGEGGYRLRSGSWNDYNKQLGDALDLASLPRAALERLQLTGYLKVFLHNRRYRDLFRFAWRYRREAMMFLRHHLLRTN